MKHDYLIMEENGSTVTVVAHAAYFDVATDIKNLPHTGTRYVVEV